MLLRAADRSGDTRCEPLRHQPGWDALGTPLQLQKGPVGKTLLELGQEGMAECTQGLLRAAICG